MLFRGAPCLVDFRGKPMATNRILDVGVFGVSEPCSKSGDRFKGSQQ